MFFNIIKKLQLLPPEKRQMLALFLSITATAMIFGLWLTTFNIGGTSDKTATEKIPTASPFAAITGAFKNLTEELSDRIGQFSDQISNFQKTEVWNSYSEASTTIQQTFEITGQ
ncbi:MAG: hypothetical protein A3D52_03110 [Candidatus Taylorbacteria bacterium RIFCSPHIGHO2_02_FULL_44_36]|uniref:Uncharacterized protein n=1 Tax=Candidatus Taylorbacteria bacterium RIFCSPLOWO2_12_FULL_44_15c TaxID=1802333 RepID=A0A1G2P4G7_9BACT|nr:MAG: hypothetical protein A3D52_03110 [Candidatus Taylorbacteria bacterium RIFCSPHIGHO2_02_FULL_44_36]OHA39368.1 MAG: hypothetical protein A3I97_00085 [Candidatus Taylorbacteria bacterium RIFCSPLOWO2_02_FULL_44_35]OHA43238.1 MAG: hypothetical protein A3G03_00765 [Candidatus Taylorbacteria bacterium RIFCSPLOWO2_12_FULL_44_15c]